MKKAIRIIIFITILLPIIYYGFIREGFSYFTGIGTPFSYFQAQKATHREILIFYEQDLVDPIVSINIDSIQLAYGFKTEFGGNEVSNSVLKLYNSTIQKELYRRLGKKWDEYLFKIDSMQKVKLNRLRPVVKKIE
ncbi:MAG: hypothetical protein PHR83_05180 [Paludibacter sp.]|nr:hypothetical protein [Paludibacter sp.]